jgi:hypothetical protein
VLGSGQLLAALAALWLFLSPRHLGCLLLLLPSPLRCCFELTPVCSAESASRARGGPCSTERAGCLVLPVHVGRPSAGSVSPVAICLATLLFCVSPAAACKILNLLTAATPPATPTRRPCLLPRLPHRPLGALAENPTLLPAPAAASQQLMRFLLARTSRISSTSRSHLQLATLVTPSSGRHQSSRHERVGADRRSCHPACLVVVTKPTGVWPSAPSLAAWFHSLARVEHAAGLGALNAGGRFVYCRL